MFVEPKCNLIIDSCCDLPFSIVDKPGIELIKFPFTMSDGEHLDDLGQSMSAHKFYDLMRKGEQPSTAQVPVGVFRDTFMRAIESGIPTVYLSFTSGLSGSFDTAVLVRNQLVEKYPDAELYVVDTLLPAIGEGLLVCEAIHQRAEGLTALEMVDWVKEARFFVTGLFMLDNLEALERGGRIPPSVALAGAKLDVKPLLSVSPNGKLCLVGIARGRKKALRQLAKFYVEHVGGKDTGQPVIVGHADCPKDADRLKDEVRKYDETALLVDASIGPVIGSHVGPGMLAITFWGTERREDLSIADRIAKRVRQK